MEKKHFVYTLQFADGSVYVGKSSTRADGYEKSRLDRHRANAKSGLSYPVYEAWRKMGEPSFSILEFCNSSLDALAAEASWIERLTEEGSAPVLNAQKPSKEKSYRMAERTRKILSEKVWHNPENKKKASERTRMQMKNGGSAYLSRLFKGRPDPFTPEARKSQTEKVKAFMNTAQGKEAARRGYKAFAANPENIKRNQEALDKWRKSEKNAEQCREMAKKAAEACSKKVMILATGDVYPSQRDAAKSLGLSEACISKWVKSGKCVRI